MKTLDLDLTKLGDEVQTAIKLIARKQRLSMADKYLVTAVANRAIVVSKNLIEEVERRTPKSSGHNTDQMVLNVFDTPHVHKTHPIVTDLELVDGPPDDSEQNDSEPVVESRHFIKYYDTVYTSKLYKGTFNDVIIVRVKGKPVLYKSKTNSLSYQFYLAGQTEPRHIKLRDLHSVLADGEGYALAISMKWKTSQPFLKDICNK